MRDFTDEELERYSRHIILQDVGIEGQEKIANSKVLVIGAGGLGSPVALYLAAAGVGEIEVTKINLPNLSFLRIRFIAFQLIFASSCPYGSSSSFFKLTFAAISSIGNSLVSCAISISDFIKLIPLSQNY